MLLIRDVTHKDRILSQRRVTVWRPLVELCAADAAAVPPLPRALTLGYVACGCALAALAPFVRSFQLARADVLGSGGFAPEFYHDRGVRAALVRRYLADVERRRLRDALTQRAGSRYVASAIVEQYLGMAAFEEWGDKAATQSYG